MDGRTWSPCPLTRSRYRGYDYGVGVEVRAGVAIGMTLSIGLAVAIGVGVAEDCGLATRENQVRLSSDRPSGSKNSARESASVEGICQHRLPSMAPLVKSSLYGNGSGIPRAFPVHEVLNVDAL